MFDPIQASEEIKSSYIDYITTSFDMADAEYALGLKRALKQEGMVAKGPYLDIGGSFEAGHTLRELMEKGEACRLFAELEPIPEKDRELKLDRPLYLHQEKALKKASKGQSLVVTTGTGSGKTESFLIPVLHHILCEVERGELDSGVRAIIIYPMNALANDQIKRLRALLKNYPAIRFGIYNGNTPHKKSEALSEYHKTHKDANGAPVDPLPNELISREEMQEEPPHILITNYSMLEYMMLRPKDDRVFSGAKLKYIVLDEAHIYKGATGMETSLLLRRLRARISEPDAVQYILTSATLGGQDADGEIVSFAEKLTGVPFSADGIIRSAERQPQMIENREIDPDLFVRLVKSPDAVGTILGQADLDFAPEGTAEEKLYALFLHLRLFAILRKEAKSPVTVTQLHRAFLSAAPGMTREQVVAFISVCARAEKDGAALIKPRYHFFVRAMEGAYITLNTPKQLFLQRKNAIEHPGQAPQEVFEAAICSDCGRLAIVGKTDKGSRRFKQFARQGKDDDAEYYLIRAASDGELFEDDEDEEEKDDGSHDYAVCPICGALSSEADLRYETPCDHAKEGYIKLRLVDHTKSGSTRCPACGFGSFRRFYLGSEAATAVLGTELFEQLPTEDVTEVAEAPRAASGLFARAAKKKVMRRERARQFLCFSDSRSEAAFFATYMERSYQEFLRRRGIWHTAETLKARGERRVSVCDFVNELSRYYEENRCFAEWDAARTSGGLTSVSRQNAWVAILNEMFNARRSTSLRSLGVLAFAYHRNEGLAEAISSAYGLPIPDAAALLEQLSQDAVFSGALNAGKEHKLTDAEREYIFFSPYEKKLVKVKTAENSKKSSVSGWCGRKRSNGNYFPNTRIARLVRALDITEDAADELLSDYWEAVFQPESESFMLDAGDFDVLLGGTDAVRFYRCKKCGRITPYSVKSRCASVKCDGELEPFEPLAHAEDNHYARLYMSEQMHPLYIKEHTAQLAKDQQTRYQEAFVNKQINALSCSTTFEMGVDVGSLETVYLRDVPPSPSNYVQRAGRAGRGKGSAAFVMTYAKLSSHDFTYYDAPESMISGKISAPIFEVENEKILYRHVNAVAISAFFEQNNEEYNGDNQTVFLNEGGYERLKDYLAGRPERLKKLLEDSIPKSVQHRLGIDDWSWVEHLCGENGTLQLAVDDFRGTVAELKKGLDAARKVKDDVEAGRWSIALRNFRCAAEDNAGRKSLISFLVRNNVLPKYGFPVDTVELLPNANSTGEEKDLQLARDLQMAIADYAPGAQVVADGKLYTSRYIRKAPGKNADLSWEIGSYCQCPSCGQPNFTKEPLVKARPCVSCQKPIPRLHWRKTLEPRLGFCADVEKRDEPVPMHRPEHDYKTDDNYIGDPQRNLLLEQEFYVNGGRVRIASTQNDSLVVVGQTRFQVCLTCGYADPIKIKPGHKTPRGYPCPNKDGNGKEYTLSHDFKTDVARVTFLDEAASDLNTMLSVLYALLEGLSREMGIERTDIKGCLFRTFEDGLLLYSVILYDAVAGGAGHVRRLVTTDGVAFQRVLRRAYDIVNGCDCGSSCYKCLRNYYNQKIHDELDRYKAAAFLKEWIGEMQTEAPEEKVPESAAENTADAKNKLELPDDFGMNMHDSRWKDIWQNALSLTDAKVERDAVKTIAAQSDLFRGKEKPWFDCVFLGEEEYGCALLWPDSRVMLFTEEDKDGLEFAAASGWKCFLLGSEELTPDILAAALKEE